MTKKIIEMIYRDFTIAVTIEPPVICNMWLQREGLRLFIKSSKIPFSNTSTKTIYNKTELCLYDLYITRLYTLIPYLQIVHFLF